MRNMWRIEDFSIGEIREYCILRNEKNPQRYNREELMSYLEYAYKQALKDNLWYDNDTGITYHGRGKIAEFLEYHEEDKLCNRYEVLEWQMGHEIYCEMSRQYNLGRLK